MKKAFCISVFFIWHIAVKAQLPDLFSDTNSVSKWNLAITTEAGFNISGYTNVREDEVEGDKLSLKDNLGLDHLFNYGFAAARKLSPTSFICFSFQKYFFIAHDVTTKNVWFNGTYLSGNSIALSSKTYLYRMRLAYQKEYNINPSTQFLIAPGLLYDGLWVYIKGNILPGSPGSEPSEDFITQALPFPNLELGLRHHFNKTSAVSLKVNASATPLFKSFFIEGGNVYLKYSSENAALSYTYTHRNFSLEPSLLLHHLRTYENSHEDMNDFSMSYWGINLSVEYAF